MGTLWDKNDNMNQARWGWLLWSKASDTSIHSVEILSIELTGWAIGTAYGAVKNNYPPRSIGQC
ncbi:hypothetical protein GQ600_9928 [Phytophthora cactorum]|nr:hypothetical protein GQ600_9928 [Phytophthora cactorum]